MLAGASENVTANPSHEPKIDVDQAVTSDKFEREFQIAVGVESDLRIRYLARTHRYRAGCQVERCLALMAWFPRIADIRIAQLNVDVGVGSRFDPQGKPVGGTWDK